MKVQVTPVGSFPTKKDPKISIFLYFISAGSVKMRASSYNRELVDGDQILLNKNGDYWNISVATGATFEVELLAPPDKDE